MKPHPTMQHVHHWRGVEFIARGCFVRFGSTCGLAVVLLCVPVLIRTSQPLNLDIPLKPKPSVVRFYKSSERPPEKLNQLQTVLLMPGAISVGPGADVFRRPSFDAFLVGARLIALHQALRAPPAQ